MLYLLGLAQKARVGVAVPLALGSNLCSLSFSLSGSPYLSAANDLLLQFSHLRFALMLVFILVSGRITVMNKTIWPLQTIFFFKCLSERTHMEEKDDLLILLD